MKFSKLISHALPVFLFAILAAGSGSKQDINCGGNNEQYSVRCDEVVAPPPPPYISAKTRAKAQRGLFDAQNGKIEKGLYWAEQAKKINLDARRDHPDFYEENQETMDKDLDYIEDSISQIKDLERESAEKKRLEAEKKAKAVAVKKRFEAEKKAGVAEKKRLEAEKENWAIGIEAQNLIFEGERNLGTVEEEKAKAVAEKKRLEAEEKAVAEKKRLEVEKKAKAVAVKKRLEAEKKAKAVAVKKRFEAEKKAGVAEKKRLEAEEMAVGAGIPAVRVGYNMDPSPRYYLKAGVGVTNYTSNKTGSYKNTVMDGATKNDFTSKINVDSDVSTEIGIGRDFGGFRTDITYSDQTKPIKSHGSTSFCYTDPDGIGNCYDATTSSGKKKIRNRNLMFNLEKDIPIGNSNKLTPFVGFGIGNSNISTPDREIVSERGDTKIIEPIKGGSTNKFIYQVTAGANYNLTDNVSIYNEVEMLSTPSYSINKSNYKGDKEVSLRAGMKLKF